MSKIQICYFYSVVGQYSKLGNQKRDGSKDENEIDKAADPQVAHSAL